MARVRSNDITLTPVSSEQGNMSKMQGDIRDKLERALAAWQRGERAGAQILASALLKTAPHNPAVLQLMAALALEDGRHDDALAFASSCLKILPAHVPVMLIAGRAARACGQLVQAADWFGRASAADPGNPDALFQLCIAQLDCGEPDAKSTLVRALRQFPDHADGWRDIGNALGKAGQLEAAAVAFARAAAASSAPAHGINHGRALLALGRHDEAVAAFARVLAVDAGCIGAMLPLAQSLRGAGDLRASRAVLERLAKLQPDNSQVFFALGLVCDDLHDLAGTLAAYETCVQCQPESPEAYVNLGMARQQSCDVVLALRAYQSAVKLRPNTFARIAQALPAAAQGQLWLNLGKLRASLGG